MLPIGIETLLEFAYTVFSDEILIVKLFPTFLFNLLPILTPFCLIRYHNWGLVAMSMGSWDSM